MKLKSKINTIIESLKDTNISEIEISSFWGARKIKLKTSLYNENFNVNRSKEKSNNVNNQEIDIDNDVSTIIPQSHVSSEPIDEEVVKQENHTIIKAPLVGTFYTSAKPGDPPFIDKNKIIKIGDPLCIVEAMKIFNTIESEHAGEIIDILVKDGDPVEFGQDLFLIKEADV